MMLIVLLVLCSVPFMVQQAWAADGTGDKAQAEPAIQTAELGLDAALRFSPTREPLSDVLNNTGDAGLGMAWRYEDSLYRGGRVRHDLVPLYLYEGERFYLQSYRAGMKFQPQISQRCDLFVSHRFEGYFYYAPPPILAGMAVRSPGLDVGFSYQVKEPWGNYFVEYLYDVSGSSMGGEFQLGYSRDWRTDGLVLTPSIVFSLRDAKLNNYYYGVRPGEATTLRPAYRAGAGLNTRIGIDARYDLTGNWRLIGGVSATRWSDAVRFSPVVESRLQIGGFVGLGYDFEPEKRELQASSPLIVKALYGKATYCDLLHAMALGCAFVGTADVTRVSGLELGRPFYENYNDWPLDFSGHFALLRHNEQGFQSDSWQFNAYMKGYFHGFPWSDSLRTRMGFGAGLSYAQSIPYAEARDQRARGLPTSKLLNYLDPSLDVSIGDLFGMPAHRDTYFGFGVTHRSGIFGSSQVLGNVNGGSNYIYSYIEWRM